jgi:DNA-binding MarR family transcriptional regulator
VSLNISISKEIVMVGVPGSQASHTQAERDKMIEHIARVLMQLSWLGQKQFARCVADHELTLPQFFVLGFLSKTEQRCSMNQLAEATHQDAATMTGVVDRLEKLGLVERRRSARDRRVVLVQPTAEGAALMEHVKQSRDMMMLRIFDTFTAEELASLSSLLVRLVAAMETGYEPHCPRVAEREP